MGHTDHHLHQVDARDGFGHRVLHLQAGVHLQEVEALVFTDHKLHRARRLVLHRFGQGHRLLTHGFACGIADERRWCFFNHFLVTALNGALALVQVNHVAMAVAQHLNFNVTGLFHKLLNEDAVVAKRITGFVAARRETFKGFFVIEGHAQTFATTAGRGFDHHGVANAFGNVDSLLGGINGIVVARNGVDLGFVGQFFGRNLVAHGRNRKVTRANEGNAFVFTAFGKGFVF